ncbi:hypothetical protein O6P43_018207 [Quillaja saponaria]|uniref:Transmembrane protein n=1 Tax=Quillaja saponaria TaxID=32244 RepID=A0AAD7LRK9_QUISA|nr:hypothetical protein O6P43_018207 [Quillaja saponaria]
METRASTHPIISSLLQGYCPVSLFVDCFSFIFRSFSNPNDLLLTDSGNSVNLGSKSLEFDTLFLWVGLSIQIDSVSGFLQILGGVYVIVLLVVCDRKVERSLWVALLIFIFISLFGFLRGG